MLKHIGDIFKQKMYQKEKKRKEKKKKKKKIAVDFYLKIQKGLSRRSSSCEHKVDMCLCDSFCDE
jgi:hypothetical protein